MLGASFIALHSLDTCELLLHVRHILMELVGGIAVALVFLLLRLLLLLNGASSLAGNVR